MRLFLLLAMRRCGGRCLPGFSSAAYPKISQPARLFEPRYIGTVTCRRNQPRATPAPAPAPAESPKRPALPAPSVAPPAAARPPAPRLHHAAGHTAHRQQVYGTFYKQAAHSPHIANIPRSPPPGRKAGRRAGTCRRCHGAGSCFRAPACVRTPHITLVATPPHLYLLLPLHLPILLLKPGLAASTSA